MVFWLKQAVFFGAATALITPMKEDGSVDFKTLKSLVDWQIEEGIDALVVCATTGECATLSQKEHIAVVAAAAEYANGRVPIVAGSGSNDTAFSVITSKEAAKAGADALLSVTPYYNKTTQKGLVRHFCAVAEAAKVPTILYNVPARTGMDISLESCKELSRHPLIAGIKEASGDAAKAARIILACGEDLPLYSGNDELAAPLLALGAKGVVSVLSNLFPRAVASLCLAGFRGEMQTLRDLHFRYLPMIDALFCEVNPIPVKYAMGLIGRQAGPVRLPLVEPEPATKALLEKLLFPFGEPAAAGRESDV